MATTRWHKLYRSNVAAPPAVLFELLSDMPNYQRWLPDLEVPYAIVLVEFDDHPGVRVTGRLRGCPPEAATIGMTVAVGFEPGPGGFAIPSFVAAPRGRGL